MLLHHFKHNKVLHEQVVLLSIVTDAVPEVAADDFVHVESFGHGFWAVTAHYGFMQTPDVLAGAARVRAQGLYLNEGETSFYLGRETLLSGNAKAWRRGARACSASCRATRARRPTFFRIPPEPRRRARHADRAVSVGARARQDR